MSDLLAARAQMGTSLAFHIIFSALGVGLPLLLCLAEGLALKDKDPNWMLLTRRWAKAAAILFAIGAVSGTILSFDGIISASQFFLLRDEKPRRSKRPPSPFGLLAAEAGRTCMCWRARSPASCSCCRLCGPCSGPSCRTTW